MNISQDTISAMTSLTNDLEEIDVLPRWAYVDDEWKDLMESIYKIVDGRYYIKRYQSEASSFLDNLHLVSKSENVAQGR